MPSSVLGTSTWFVVSNMALRMINFLFAAFNLTWSRKVKFCSFQLEENALIRLFEVTLTGRSRSTYICSLVYCGLEHGCRAD